MKDIMSQLKEMENTARLESVEAKIKLSKISEAITHLEAAILATELFKDDPEKKDLLKMFYEFSDEKLKDAGVYK